MSDAVIKQRNYDHLVAMVLKLLLRQWGLLAEVKKLRERNGNLKLGNAKLRELRLTAEKKLADAEAQFELHRKAQRQEISLLWDKLNQERMDNGNTPISTR